MEILIARTERRRSRDLRSLAALSTLLACTSGSGVGERHISPPTAALGRLVEADVAGLGAAIPPTTAEQDTYGAIAADVNGDGRPDVLGWSSQGWVLMRQSAGGGFEPASRSSVGLRCAGFGDLDGDGMTDAVLGQWEPRFMHNEGGTLVDRTQWALGGVRVQGEIYGVTFADIDYDGLLDVALAQMNCGRGPNWVFRNEGDFHFVDVAPELGLDLPDGATFSLAIDAVADDGVLHVWNFTEGCVERRMSHWRFRAGDDLPVRIDERATLPQESDPMGSALLDVNRDGHLDLFISLGGPNLVLSGPEYVAPLPDARGLGAPPTESQNPFTGWSAVLFDADLDGHPDVYVTHTAQRPEQPPLRITDMLYLRAADGTYRDAAARVGIVRDHSCQSAFGIDLDLDGDTDLLTGCYGGVRTLRNDLVARPPGRTVRLRGTASNADGVHAILVGPSGERRVQRGGGQPYAGGVVRESFRAEAGEHITVLWPSGIRQTVDVGSDGVLTVVEPQVMRVTPRRVAVGARTPVHVVVEPAALGTPNAPVRVEISAGRWSEPMAPGADGSWRGTLLPPAERSTTAITVTVGDFTLRVRPKIFVR